VCAPLPRLPKPTKKRPNKLHTYNEETIMHQILVPWMHSPTILRRTWKQRMSKATTGY
jgi:hypothetical protein